MLLCGRVVVSCCDACVVVSCGLLQPSTVFYSTRSNTLSFSPSHHLSHRLSHRLLSHWAPPLDTWAASKAVILDGKTVILDGTPPTVVGGGEGGDAGGDLAGAANRADTSSLQVNSHYPLVV